MDAQTGDTNKKTPSLADLLKQTGDDVSLEPLGETLSEAPSDTPAPVEQKETPVFGVDEEIGEEDELFKQLRPQSPSSQKILSQKEDFETSIPIPTKEPALPTPLPPQEKITPPKVSPQKEEVKEAPIFSSRAEEGPVVEKNIPSREDILLTEKNLTTEGNNDTALRDPLFASKILEQERVQEETPRTLPRPEFLTEEAKEALLSPLKRVRTFQADVADAMKEQKTSMVQMVLKEQEKRSLEETFEEARPTKKLNIKWIVLTLLFIGLGAGALAGAFVYIKRSVPILNTEAPKITYTSLFYVEQERVVETDALTTEEFFAATRDFFIGANPRLGEIESLVLTQNVAGGDGNPVPIPLTSEQFISKLSLRMPETMRRILLPEYFSGVYVFNGNEPILIFKVRYFENAFAGMLQWESTMARDLLPLFGRQGTTGSGRTFEDIVVKNRDLRALRDQDGTPILLYSFFDRNTVVIATSEETFEEAVERLNRPKPAR